MLGCKHSREFRLNRAQICKRKSKNLNSIERENESMQLKCNSNNKKQNKFKNRNSNSIQIQSTRKYKLMTNWTKDSECESKKFQAWFEPRKHVVKALFER